KEVVRLWSAPELVRRQLSPCSMLGGQAHDILRRGATSLVNEVGLRGVPPLGGTVPVAFGDRGTNMLASDVAGSHGPGSKNVCVVGGNRFELDLGFTLLIPLKMTAGCFMASRPGSWTSRGRARQGWSMVAGGRCRARLGSDRTGPAWSRHQSP